MPGKLKWASCANIEGEAWDSELENLLYRDKGESATKPLFVAYYLARMSHICDYCQFPPRLSCTAQYFFAKFYQSADPFIHQPRIFLLCCISIAIKTEEVRSQVHFNSVIQKLTGLQFKDLVGEVLSKEPILLEGISSHLHVDSAATICRFLHDREFSRLKNKEKLLFLIMQRAVQCLVWAVYPCQELCIHENSIVLGLIAWKLAIDEEKSLSNHRIDFQWANDAVHLIHPDGSPESQEKDVAQVALRISNLSRQAVSHLQAYNKYRTGEFKVKFEIGRNKARLDEIKALAKGLSQPMSSATLPPPPPPPRSI